MSFVEEGVIGPILRKVGFGAEQEVVTCCSLTPVGMMGSHYDAALFARTAFMTDLKGYLQRSLVKELGWSLRRVSAYVELIQDELNTECWGPFDAHIYIQSVLSQKVPHRDTRGPGSGRLPYPMVRWPGLYG
ncbi:hypothetical protein GGR58DRAFT_469038 [Xylaria digitata]|nr:hypothetical protein GGR58DRAFT_469038 [Xylaria digitata]